MLETPGDHSVAADGATDSPEVSQYRFRLRPDPQPRGRLRATRAAVTAAAWGLGSSLYQESGTDAPCFPRPRSDGPGRLAPLSPRCGSPSMYSSWECPAHAGQMASA